MSELILGKLDREGERRVQVLERRRCEVCGAPATRRLTWLLENYRRNPASSAYGMDDCSWCSDLEKFVCEECLDSQRKDVPPGFAHVPSVFPCIERFQHMFLVWTTTEDEETGG